MNVRFWVAVAGTLMWGWLLLLLPTRMSQADEASSLADVPALSRLVKDGSASAYLAAEALGHLGTAAKEASAVLEGACAAKDGRLRVAAAVALLEIHPKEESPARAKGIAALLGALDDKSEDIRREAARGLARVKKVDAAGMDRLARALADEDPFVATHVADTLAELGEPAVPALSRGVENDATVMLALVALGRMGEKATSAQGAISARLKDADAIVRQEAALALSQIKPEPASAVAALLPLLDDPARGVKAAAAVGISAQGAEGKKAASKLESMLDDADEFTRLVGAYGLAMIESVSSALENKVVTILTKGLSDPRPLVRREALHALGRLGLAAQSAKGEIEKLLNDPEVAISSAAREVLASMSREVKK